MHSRQMGAEDTAVGEREIYRERKPMALLVVRW
jgi:hypothetical protein